MSGQDLNEDIVNRHEIKIAELEKQLQQLKRDYECSTKENKELRQQVGGCSTKIKQLEDDKADLKVEVNELKKKIKSLQDEVKYFSTKSAITDLKREIEEKDARIYLMEEKFKKELNDVKLQMEKESVKKDNRIKVLENEVKYFSSKSAITDLKKKMDSMDKSHTEKLNVVKIQVKEELKKKDTKIQSMDEKLNLVMKEMVLMKKEILFFSKGSQEKDAEIERKGKDLDKCMAKIDDLEKSRNTLYIGQLCANVMEAMYREVLPIYFERGNDYKQPHLRDINKNITELCKTRKDKREAQRKWKKLQTEKIDPDENKVKEVVDFMEEMLAERNEVAHPPLYEKELEYIEDIASKLPGQQQQQIQKVIQISNTMPTHVVAMA